MHRPTCRVANGANICQHRGRSANCSFGGHATPTANGSWFLSSKYNYNLDLGLAGAIARLVGSQGVLELGAGTGCYKSALLDAGVHVDGAYDGAANVLAITNGFVQHADVTANVTASGVEPTDWVLCLEVAEHIPRHLEHIFLDNLNACALQGLILSWSDGWGNGHVNLRDAGYVTFRLSSLGFLPDHNATRVLRSGVSSFLWFRRTLQVFRRDPTAVEHHQQLLKAMWQRARPTNPVPSTLCSEAFTFPVKFLGVRNDGRRCGNLDGAPDDFESPLCQGATSDGYLEGVSVEEAKVRCTADDSCAGFYALQPERSGRRNCGVPADNTCVRPVFAWSGTIYRSGTTKSGTDTAIAFEKHANASRCVPDP